MFFWQKVFYQYWHTPHPAAWQRRVFRLLAVGGLAMLLLTPPFFGNDEEDYLFRAWQLSRGELLAQHRPGFSGGHIPASWHRAWHNVAKPAQHNFHHHLPADSLWHYLQEPLAPHHTRLMDFRNTALYSPVGFLPHLPAMWLGQGLELSAFGTLYLARLLQYLLWLWLGWLALRRLPAGSFAALLLLFLPMSLYQATTLTADALNNGLAFLFVATLLRWRARGDFVGGRRVATVVGFLLAFALIKQVYVLLAGALLLLTAAQCGGRRRQWGVLVGSLALALGVGALWSGWVLQVYEPMQLAATPADHRPAATLRWILAHPAEYALAVLRGMLHWAGTLWATGLGVLGKSSVLLPHRVYVLLSVALGVLWVADTPPGPPPGYLRRAALLGLFLLGTAAVFLVISLTYYGPGDLRFAGVVGRYLLPLLPLLLPALMPRLPALAGPRTLALFTLLVAGYALLESLRALVQRYYGVDFLSFSTGG